MRCVSYMVTIVLLALAGCQTHPQVNAHIDTVNAEYRQLEDYVYCLEDEVARLQLQLDAARAGGGSDPVGQSSGGRGGLFRRRPDATPRGGGATPGEDAAPQIEVPGSSAPATPGRSRMQRPDLSPPAIELPAPGAPAAPESVRPASGQQPIADDKLAQPARPPRPIDTRITHIALSPVLTGGADFDSQPGDDGLCVVIEPRNAAEEPVLEAGPISIVVLDPSKQGETARVARWDFDLSAARQKLANSAHSPAGRGIKLELPWPATPPAANRLHLFVRYETADGRKLQTDREIFLTPPGQVSNRWTPRTVERVRSSRRPDPGVGSQESAGGNQESGGRNQNSPDVKPPALLSGDQDARAVRPAWSPHR